jgi:hypothetical protein
LLFGRYSCRLPTAPAGREHILQVIDYYDRDYANLRTHSKSYPTPDALRTITKQGAIERAGPAGVDKPTEGSNWIVQSGGARHSCVTLPPVSSEAGRPQGPLDIPEVHLRGDVPSGPSAGCRPW